ncbi:hypothetical protein [Endozoicomonas lisbonensis]|uniref:Uncharacterized protein n=1 Tax=Endozoicomonas lisbonensis TaxID=3120522 RepID=A0ABV2SDB2_9GAMM
MTDNQTLFTGDMLIDVVRNQLNEGNPIKVKETMMRLRMTGFSEQEALEYIACALGQEMTHVVEDGMSFDENRYGQYLDTLPELPWADE